MTDGIETKYEEVDLFTDDLEPKTFEWKLFYVRMPKEVERKTGQTVTAWVAVDQHGYCELRDWYYFGLRDPHEPYHLSNEEECNLYEAQRAVWFWLQEWELVELKPIGPEDSEYFATEKLVNKNEQPRRHVDKEKEK